MQAYYIHYVDQSGGRLADIAARAFSDSAAARGAALAIVRNFADGHDGGFMQVCDDAGLCCSEIHFPVSCAATGSRFNP